jgi:hypothetical protein
MEVSPCVAREKREHEEAEDTKMEDNSEEPEA